MCGVIGWVLLGANLAAGQSAFSQCNNKMYVHRGIVLLGFPCPQNVKGSVVSTQKGINKIIKALDLLATQSPRSFAVIGRLKKSGPVMIVYDPSYPPPGKNLMSIQNALFLPTFVDTFDKKSTGKKFTVIVGRDGIKQSLPKLSAVLAHELMGHGQQYLDDRIFAMRVLDVECEAWLLEELVYQDLNVNKLSQDMVEFRRNLETLHCNDFIRYMRKRLPQQASLWDVQNPDVMKLLNIFKGYIKVQREMGMISSAQVAAKKQREAAISKISRHGSPQDYFDIGVMFMTAVGQKIDSISAAKWYAKAAHKGHAGAQLALAQLYENGDGVKQDLGQALKLYVQAAKQGKFEAFYALGVLFEEGRGVRQDLDKAQALFARAQPGIDTRPLVTFGIMYNDGTGFAQNSTKAHEFFLKAARLGDKAAQFELGLWLEQGVSVHQDMAMASTWIHKSADQGYAPALRKLAAN